MSTPRPTRPAGGRGGGGGFFRGPSGEQTPLMLAARANQLEVMKALVEAGADPKLSAQDGSTLLMAAANSGMSTSSLRVRTGSGGRQSSTTPNPQRCTPP